MGWEGVEGVGGQRPSNTARDTRTRDRDDAPWAQFDILDRAAKATAIIGAAPCLDDEAVDHDGIKRRRGALHGGRHPRGI